MHADRHRERAGTRARALFVQDGGRQQIGAPAPVLLVVLHAEEAELAHARPDPARHAPRALPLLDVRHDLLLDEGADGGAKHLVLLVEDLHRGAQSIT
jgi:hypothetical protein